MRVSIIIPVLDEADVLADSLQHLQKIRSQGHEIIVVDGGSTDESQNLAEPLADHLLVSTPGRAVQMNKGAAVASGDVFLFLHVDTILPDDGIAAVIKNVMSVPDAWGRFDVRLSGSKRFFRVIGTLMNWRSRLTGIATGDQAIFVSCDLFQRMNGYADIPLMEDVEMCRRLKNIQDPVCLSQQVITSSRRWEMGGTMKTILLMWRLRLAYWLGADPVTLARRYH